MNEKDNGRNNPISPTFAHIIFKRLSSVEADPSRSNQHEFNGSTPLRGAFGTEPRRVRTDFVWMPDDGVWISATGDLTWYDARARHPVRTEFRLYYRSNEVTRRAAAEDILLLGLRSDDTALALIASSSGLAAARIFWLFGIEVAPGAGFSALALDPAAQQSLAARLGIGRSGDDGNWSAEEPMNSSRGELGLRAKTARMQRMIGNAAEPCGIAGALPDDWLAERVPPALDGERLGRTIRGILAPRSRE